MKKPLIFLLAVCCSVPAVAQDWKEALRNAASNIVDKATGGKATEALMVGDWEYASPGVKLGSDDLLADVGASALTGRMEAQLGTLYALAGIRAGACRFSFAADKSFTAAFGSRMMQGTYEFAGESHDIVLHFATNSNYDLGTFSGKAYLSGTDLQLLFPATRLLKLVDALGRKLAAFNATAATVSALVGKFDDLWLGFEFKKE